MKNLVASRADHREWNAKKRKVFRIFVFFYSAFRANGFHSLRIIGQKLEIVPKANKCQPPPWLGKTKKKKKTNLLITPSGLRHRFMIHDIVFAVRCWNAIFLTLKNVKMFLADVVLCFAHPIWMLRQICPHRMVSSFQLFSLHHEIACRCTTRSGLIVSAAWNDSIVVFTSVTTRSHFTFRTSLYERMCSV